MASKNLLKIALTVALASIVCTPQTATAKNFTNNTSASQSRTSFLAEARGGSSSKLPELNAKVLSFAVQNQGKQVGDGECWTLAAEALAHAGAKHARGYVFGRELSKKDDWLPGDIIQFTSCHFEETTANGWAAFDMGWPNHTAIIQSLPQGKTVILHQNFGNDRRVQMLTIDFRNLKSGSFKVFRPVVDDNGYGESDDEGNLYLGFHPSAPRNSAPESNQAAEAEANSTTSGREFNGNSYPGMNNGTGGWGANSGPMPGYGSSETPMMRGFGAGPRGHEGPWSKVRKHWKDASDIEPGSTADGALGETIEIANGPMYQERTQLLARIRRFQANGGEASQFLQMFQRLETRAKAISASQVVNSTAPAVAPVPDSELINAINTLNRLLSFREGQMPHHMQP